MGIKIIATMSANGVVGTDVLDLPWEPIIEDVQHYMALTKDQTVVLGHSTFKAMGEEPLGNRETIVLTRTTTQHKKHKRLKYVSSIAQIVRMAKDKTVWVLGGASVFANFLPLAEEVYLSVLEKSYVGSRHLPKMPKHLYMASTTLPIHNLSTGQVWHREVYEKCDEEY